MARSPRARSLDEIAESIRSHWKATEEDRFAIGRDLLEARERFPGDLEFGRWLRESNFPFTRQWALTLRLAAENEPAVREALTTQVVSGDTPNLKKAVQVVLHPLATADEVEPESDGYRRLITALSAIESLSGTDFADLFDGLTPYRQARAKASAHRAERVVRRMCRTFDALVVNVVIPNEVEGDVE